MTGLRIRTFSVLEPNKFRKNKALKSHKRSYAYHRVNDSRYDATASQDIRFRHNGKVAYIDKHVYDGH